MIQLAPSRGDPALMTAWRRQVGSQFRHRSRGGPRPLAALAYCARGPVVNGLIDLRNLEVWILHDTLSSYRLLCHRLACYRAVPIRWGVSVGGAAQICLEKDLALMPNSSRACRRISSANGRLLSQALQLDRYLERHARYPYFPRSITPRLPQFLVALKQDDPEGDGPELAALCQKTGMDAKSALARFCRLHNRQWLYPLPFVSNGWDEFQSVFVDTKTMPKRQVFRLDGDESLVGYCGAVQFDLLGSRFLDQPW